MDDMLNPAGGAETPQGPGGEGREMPETWTPELAKTLQSLLRRAGSESLDLRAELETLERQHDDAVYTEWLRLLAHLHFEPAEAKQHWHGVLEHCHHMESRLDHEVDPRVALISYFLEVQPRFENPIVIEMRLFEQTRDSAYRDELTGLRNYRFFTENLKREVRRSERFNQPVSLVMLDVDDFKIYNDRHGHEAGNRALEKIGQLLNESSRMDDGVSRFGGEEFTLTLPATSKLAAEWIAKRVLEAIERQPFPGEEQQPNGRLTASAGVAVCPGDAGSAEELLQSADRAMYLAKSGGKGRVQLYDDNRRSHPRVEVALAGSFRALEKERRPLSTLDISSGGLKFSAAENLPIDTLLEVQLQIPGTQPTVNIVARVVSVKVGADSRCEIAARAVEIGTEHLRTLLDYLRSVEPE